MESNHSAFCMSKSKQIGLKLFDPIYRVDQPPLKTFEVFIGSNR